jgi:hypothetical protein
MKENYIRHADEEFHYSINIPSDWKKSVKDLGNGRILFLEYGKDIDITVSATRLNYEEQARWETWHEWYVKEFGSGPLRIIKTKELDVGNGALCKFLVFEYTRHGEKFLHRALMMMRDDSVLLIACRAPTRHFSRHIDVFDAVMSSVDFFEGAESDVYTDVTQEEKKAPEPAVRKKQQPVKEEKAVAKPQAETKQQTKKEEKIKPAEESDKIIEQDPGTYLKLEQDGIIERIR